MKNAYATRPTLGVAIIAAIAAACFSPEGEEKRLVAERVREARALQRSALQPATAVLPAPARPTQATNLARAAP